MNALKLVLLLVILSSGAAPAGAQPINRFEGKLSVEWLVEKSGPDRKMRLLEPFSFVDRKGEVWKVPEGAVVDGASIPRVLWTFLGSPFVGDYRRASVVHDHFCKTKSRPWNTVHRMFYEAVLASSVPKLRAKLYYAALWARGPRWAPVMHAEPGGPMFVTLTPEFSDADFAELKDWVLDTDPELDELENYIDQILQAQP